MREHLGGEQLVSTKTALLSKRASEYEGKSHMMSRNVGGVNIDPLVSRVEQGQGIRTGISRMRKKEIRQRNAQKNDGISTFKL